MVVAAESDADALGKLDWTGMEVETYVAAYNQSDWRDQARKARFKDPIQGGLEAVRMWGQQCDLLLSDQPLTARLKEFGADVLFGDWAYYCTPALSEVLKLPRVTVSNIPILDPVHTTWDRSTGRRMHAANMLAYTPQVGTGFPSAMNLVQRVENVITYAVASFIDWIAFHRMIYKPLGEKHGIDLGTPEALGRGVMHLFNVDFALEFPRKLPPNVKLVGPLMPEPAKPLPADLEEFMAGSGDMGVVYVSLGTVCSIGAQEFRKLAAALSALPAHVIWKVGADDLPEGVSLAALGLGDNVKVVQWAPQNDLLGHAKTRAFLTHGGVNGLYEAAYHGVPIAGIPLIADQKDNVAKAVHRGFGLAVDPRGGLTAARIGGALQRLLAEPGFRAAAGKLSRRLRSRPRTPAQEAADWVQHVIETDGEPYLHTPEDAIPLASLLLLDVFTFLLVAMLAPIGLAWMVGSRVLAHVRAPKTKTA
ncbi:UDP-glucuronosyltransferase 2B20 [Coccomyxa sp. Obi]|nr:UDP-glucuronosyltransferase 2B20 [Coccomyxa sp. Obi]